MKKFLFTLIAFTALQSASAQTEKLIVQDSGSPKFQQQLLFPNRIINKTDKGTVYALPQDNMPVFVPDSSVTAKMPVALKNHQSGAMMPNPYYRNKPSLEKTDSPPKQIPLNKYQYKPNPDIKKSIEKQ